MLFHGPLDGVLGTPTGVAILRTLLRHPTKEFSGRELARLTGVSPSKTIRQLEVLRAHGLVQRRAAGRTHLWKVSREHFLVSELSRVFRAERQALRALGVLVRDALAGVEVRRVVLFGSVARGEERPDSDVDLLVVVATAVDKRKALSRLLELGQEMLARFGNGLSPLLYTAREADALQGSELMRSIERDGVDLGADA